VHGRCSARLRAPVGSRALGHSSGRSVSTRSPGAPSTFTHDPSPLFRCALLDHIYRHLFLLLDCWRWSTEACRVADLDLGCDLEVEIVRTPSSRISSRHPGRPGWTRGRPGRRASAGRGLRARCPLAASRIRPTRGRPPASAPGRRTGRVRVRNSRSPRRTASPRVLRAGHDVKGDHPACAGRARPPSRPGS